jgi:exopolysaccharide biosynthesis polyprenyl glycosylphosphotransferase
LTVARLAFDGAVVVLAAILAFVLRFEVGWFQVAERGQLDFSSHLVASLVWVAALLGAMGLNRLYDDDTLFLGGGELPRVLRSIVEAVAVVSVFVYFTNSFSVSSSWLGLTALLSAAFLFAERVLVRGALRRERKSGRLRRPVLLLSKGSAEQLEATVAAVSDFQVVDRIDPGDWRALGAELSAAHADLVVAASDFEDEELWKMVIEAGKAGRSVFLQSPVRSIRRDRLTMREVGGRTLMKVAPPYFTGFRAVRKRTFDVVVAAVLLVITLPVALIVGVLILLTSGWPVLYRQQRVGKGGQLFHIWKFRTMHRGADRQTQKTWTTVDDPRRTRIGAILRRFSLDELPQLWNVFLGHMSLVGPRPLWVNETQHPRFADRFKNEERWYEYRYRIRPGITGWAQVHGLRGHTPLDPWVQHDNWYIENWSLALDVKILLRTISEIVRPRNAY